MSEAHNPRKNQAERVRRLAGVGLFSIAQNGAVDVLRSRYLLGVTLAFLPLQAAHTPPTTLAPQGPASEGTTPPRALPSGSEKLAAAHPEGHRVTLSPQRALSANTLYLQGTVSWQLSGNFARLRADRVVNSRSTSTASLYLTLIATPLPARYGDDLSTGSYVLARYSMGSLSPGFSFFNVDSGFLSVQRPPNGTYALCMTLDEFQGSTGYYYDLVPFPTTETFGANCAQDATTLCLSGGRFSVRSNWSVPSQGTSGVGTALPLPGSDTGYFWFFSSNAAELMVKIVDGRAVNGRFWVFYGALSDVNYTITVADTQTGEARTYQNPSGHLASVADVAAFPLSGGAPIPTPTPPPTPTLAGTWQGSIASADPNCSGFGAQFINGSFNQSGSNFAGTFSLPGNSSGFFQGVLLANSVSGVFTTTSSGCTGSGNFTGTLSGNALTISAPAVSTAQSGCLFCQQNTVTLHRVAP